MYKYSNNLELICGPTMPNLGFNYEDRSTRKYFIFDKEILIIIILLNMIHQN